MSQSNIPQAERQIWGERGNPRRREESVRVLSLRLASEQAAMLELVARADNQTITDAIRTAIDAHIDARRQDKEFTERLRKRHEQEGELYKQLRESR